MATKQNKNSTISTFEVNCTTKKYVVQDLADNFGSRGFHIKIIFLPVAPLELNPIEMVWGTVKRAISGANTNFRLTEVEKLTRQELSKYTAEVFSKFVKHVMKVEAKFKKCNTILDDIYTDSEDESFDSNYMQCDDSE